MFYPALFLWLPEDTSDFVSIFWYVPIFVIDQNFNLLPKMQRLNKFK